MFAIVIQKGRVGVAEDRVIRKIMAGNSLNARGVR